MNYKLSYDFDAQLNCGIICINELSVLMDFNDLFSIINFNKNFIYFDPDNKDYPFYFRHHRQITYLEYLFKYDSSNIEYVFKNNNKFDLRRENILIYHKFHKNIANKYTILDFKLGHFFDTGTDAYVIKNPIWKIMENDKEYLLMYCEKDTIIKLCQKSLDKISEHENTKNKGNKLTFFKLQNGYIMGSNNLYIHQIITGCYGNGQGTLNVSVDHIDQDPLNNSWENLRIATRKEQEQNSKGIKTGTKRERKHDAQKLPDGITQDMIKKYVVYYKDYADKEKTTLREYFRVESHPKLDKVWSTTKSIKVTIQEKLLQANKVVDNLENDIYPEKDEIMLPKYVSLIVSRDKPHLVFEKKIDGKRLNVKMVLPKEYNLQDEIEKLIEKVKEKYNITLTLLENNNNFKYKLCIELDDTKKNVDKITFNISRFRKYKHTIEFNEFVTKKYAVQKAEEWLSEKVTLEHYNLIKDDLFFSLSDYGDLNYILNKNKGQLLTDCIFLEEADIYSTHLFIDCGS
jgi:hypothetical protein